MTVPSEQSSIQYDADGVSVSFPVPFRFIQDSHLRVTLLHADVETVLVLGSDYSVSGANDPAGGSVTTAVAYPLGDSLTIERIVPITQETAYQRNDPFPERAHEQALDKLTMIAQQIASVFGMTFGSTLRALLLGAADKDGSGAYRANNNRISNLGDPQASRDAVHRQWVDARISEAAIDGAGQFVVERLADPTDPDNGAGMVGFMGTTVATQLRSSRQRVDHQPFAESHVVRDGTVDGLHRHFGGLVEGMNGRLHLFYGRNVEHATTPGTVTWYCHSDDGGATWSDEVPAMPSEPGFDVRNTCLGITPTGRILMAYATAHNDDGVPTTFRIRMSDNNDVTGFKQGSDWYVSPYTYARCYGRIKTVPGGNGMHRLVMTPYYQSSSTPTYRVPVWTSDDDGETWFELAPISDGTGGGNETELVALSGDIWIAVSRTPLGLRVSKTTDGGQSWGVIGIVPLTSTGNYVAPTVDRFDYEGETYVLLGYCNRTNDALGDRLLWRIALADDLLGDDGANAWSGLIVGATDMDNASGYQCPVTNPAGDVYVQGRVAYVEFKEYVGADYSQVRFVKLNVIDLARSAGRTIPIVSDEITVSRSPLEQFVYVATEGAAPTDDVYTIKGGYEGQVLAFRSPSASRDPIFRVMTGIEGNLMLNSDCRLANGGMSWLVLRKCGNYWVELGRSHDTEAIPSTMISGGAIAVRPSVYLSPLLVGAEGGAPTDDLDTITGGLEGQIIVLASTSSAQSITLRDGVGNLDIVGSFTLTHTSDTITLMRRGTTWREISRSDNA